MPALPPNMLNADNIGERARVEGQRLAIVINTAGERAAHAELADDSIGF